MQKDKDIYGLEVKWVRYDTGSKTWYLKASIAYALKHDDLRDEMLEFIKSL
jgi:UTP-glucose-1-phosphate uridylyltransferase